MFNPSFMVHEFAFTIWRISEKVKEPTDDDSPPRDMKCQNHVYDALDTMALLSFTYCSLALSFVPLFLVLDTLPLPYLCGCICNLPFL